MQFSLTTNSPQNEQSDCLIIGIFEDAKPSDSALEIDQLSNNTLSKLIDRNDLSGKLGSCDILFDLQGIKTNKLLVVGMGKQNNLTRNNFNTAILAAAENIKQRKIKTATCFLGDFNVDGIEQTHTFRNIAEIFAKTCYSYTETINKEITQATLEQLLFSVPKQLDKQLAQQALTEAKAIADGTILAMNLANLPPNICNPAFLAEQAVSIANEHEKVNVEIIDEDEIKQLGMDALISVGQGSVNKSKLIILKYEGTSAANDPHILVGKGITFDSGGISLKPSPDMHEMKYDMGGAAAVIGTFYSCIKLNLPINLIAMVPAAENLPDGNSYRPGDVINSLAGKTIEILNTDAEGRLILCDALTYAKRFNPKTMIDVATLTGACVIALGHHTSGFMTKSESLATEIKEASMESNDSAWQMPLWEIYESDLDSQHADIANVGPKAAGAITAACFLSKFTEDIAWAHIDVAGTAWKPGKKGHATGRPVPLLTQYLINQTNSN